MIQIGLVLDLRNKFPDIEKAVGSGEPVYLTKNGYGAMVVLGLEAYSKLTDGVEAALLMKPIKLLWRVMNVIHMRKSFLKYTAEIKWLIIHCHIS